MAKRESGIRGAFRQQLDMSGLAEGVYVLRISDEENVVLKRIVKE